MTRLFLDFETFSELKLGQGGHGLGRYSRHPSTECLMLAWAFDKDDVQQVEWAPGAGRSLRRIPKDVRDALRDPAVTKSAWNAQFEIQIFKHVLGLDVDLSSWQCSMALAMTLSFPGALDRVGKIIGLPTDKKKDARGKALIRKFCGMQRPSKARPEPFRVAPQDAPGEWVEFLAYNRQDIEAERAIWRRLRKWDMPAHEWDTWRMDQEINEAGIPINRRRVENALRLADEFTRDTLSEMREVTDLRNPNSGQQLLGWVRGRGYPYLDLKKGHVRKALDEVRAAPERHWLFPWMSGKDKSLEFVLEARSEISKSSVKKLAAILNALDDDDALRFCFQFAGAQRTWRFAGRILQPQNLPRPPKALEKVQQILALAVENSVTVEELVAQFMHAFPDHRLVKPLMSLLAASIRPVIEAPDGYLIADADLNAIENRGLGWVSGDEKILDVFRNGRDPYVDFATFMFNGAYEALWAEYKAGDGTKRTTSKPAVLGCFGPDTLVLTDGGWVRIVDVTEGHRVFDGVEFVRHAGVLNQGLKFCLCWQGILVTPEHKIWVGDGWREAWRVAGSSTLLRRAIGSVPGWCSRIEAGRRSGVGAIAGPNTRFGSITSSGEFLRSATVARLRHVAGTLVRGSGRRSMTRWRTDFMPSGVGARTQRALSLRTMAAAALSAGSSLLKNLYPTWSAFSGLTDLSKLIVSTTTGITSRATCVSPTGASTTAIVGTAPESSIAAACTALRNFAESLRQSIVAPVRFFGNGRRGLPLSRLFEIKPTVKESITFDIAKAGPRSRFVIWSEAGPLIVHNCGYGLSGGYSFENEETGETEATGLLGYAWAMGVRLDEETAQRSVAVWRETYVDTVNYWYELERAAARTIKTGRPHEAKRVRFDVSGPFLRMILPSGHPLYYCRPRLEARMMPWGKIKEVLTYEGLDDKGQWTRIQTRGAKLVENLVQAISRDLLVHGMKLARREGLDVRLHVHDQIAALVPEDSARESLELLKQCMTEQPKWAKDLPLGAGGHLSKVFIKD